MEASTLSHAARRGLLTRKSPLLKLKGDEQLIALVRSGNSGAFDIIVDRYQARLLGFCRQMIGSTEDAEDVLQEVFVNAYKAMIADNREINLRPWLYRIARNRSLNHLRKPKADAQESMDMVPMAAEAGTAEKVHNREEFRQLLKDVTKLPETQRAALLLREIDALSYEEIAEAMDTTVPSVKSLLVRARISLAEATQARMLTCGEVRVELAEAAEGLAKASGPVRRHVRDCEQCADFRKQLRSDTKVLAMMFPVGGLIALKAAIGAKLGFGSGAGAGASAGAGAGAAGAGAGAAGAGAAAGTGAAGAAGAAAGVSAIGAGTAASGLGAVGSAVGAKALAGVVTAAVITAGAVEVKKNVSANPVNESVTPQSKTIAMNPPVRAQRETPVHVQPVEAAPEKAAVEDTVVPVETVPQEPAPETVPVADTDPAVEPPVEPIAVPVPVPEEDCHIVGDYCVSNPDIDNPHVTPDPSTPKSVGEVETGTQTQPQSPPPVKPAEPSPPATTPPVVTPPSSSPVPNPLPSNSPQGGAPQVPQGQ